MEARKFPDESPGAGGGGAINPLLPGEDDAEIKFEPLPPTLTFLWVLDEVPSGRSAKLDCADFDDPANDML